MQRPARLVDGGRAVAPPARGGCAVERVAGGGGFKCLDWLDWSLRHFWERLVHALEDEAQLTMLQTCTYFRDLVVEEENKEKEGLLLVAREVADELGMSLGAVRVAQSRVLRALRQIGEELID